MFKLTDLLVNIFFYFKINFIRVSLYMDYNINNLAFDYVRNGRGKILLAHIKYIPSQNINSVLYTLPLKRQSFTLDVSLRSISMHCWEGNTLTSDYSKPVYLLASFAFQVEFFERMNEARNKQIARFSKKMVETASI